MLAAVVHGPADLRVEEIPEPRCAPDGVIVQMAFGGICGSDIAYWRSGISGTAELREPLVLGHEVSGTVAEIGPEAAEGLAARGMEVGTAVTVHPATLVGAHEVPASTSARANLWPEVRYFGSAALLPHEQGGFSSHRAVRADQLRAVPAGVSLQEAALAEPFGVALHAVQRAGDLHGARVLINGAGPIGALAVVAAHRAGAAQVIAADLSSAALDIAARLGADEVVDISAGQALPQDVDAAIEASGSPRALGGVIAAVRRGGVLVQVGNLPTGEVSASLGGIVTREIDYRGSYRFVDEITDALAAMAEGVDLTPLITHTFPLADAEEAFAVAADRATGSSKVLLALG